VDAALDEVRLYARPTARGPAAVEGGRFAATYFRVALGFDARTGALAWARAQDADFLGGAAYAGGFALCDARGAVTFLDGRTGGVAGRVTLPRPVDACLVQADALTKPAAPGAPLADQLAEVVKRPDADLAPLRPALLHTLAQITADRAPRAKAE
jgi:outer membrane protein assembly factor BamB